MLGVKYLFEIVLICFFKALEHFFEVRDINIAFAQKIFYMFLHKDNLYSFFQKIYLFVFYVI